MSYDHENDGSSNIDFFNGVSGFVRLVGVLALATGGMVYADQTAKQCNPVNPLDTLMNSSDTVTPSQTSSSGRCMVPLFRPTSL